MAANDNGTAERRRDDRRDLSGKVTVSVPAQALDGSGDNVSDDGLYFVAGSALEVEVQLPGEATPRRGKLVRVAALAEGRVGIAVKFAN